MKTRYGIFSSMMVLVIFGLIFSACKKESTPISSGNGISAPTGIVLPTPDPTANAGLGHQPGDPTGVQFNLPSEIKLVGVIRGGVLSGKSFMVPAKTNDVPAILKIGSEDYTTFGTGMGYVDLYATFINTGGLDVNLCVPGGLLFEDTSHYHQNGILLQSVFIPMGAGETVNVCFKTYCCNAGIPGSNYETIYVMGHITNYSYLQELVVIMQSKQYPAAEDITKIQQIIWYITDNGPMTQAQRDYLNSLP